MLVRWIATRAAVVLVFFVGLAAVGMGAASPAFACGSNEDPTLGPNGDSPNYIIGSGTGCDYVSAKPNSFDNSYEGWYRTTPGSGSWHYNLGPQACFTGSFTQLIDSTSSGWQFHVENLTVSGEAVHIAF